MTPPTYATARAACVARYGEPAYEYAHDGDAACPAFRSAEWAGEVVPELCEQDGRLTLYVFDLRGNTPTREACEAWTLAGEPTPDAPATTLPAALDAADAFLRTHAHSTKGPTP